MLADLCCQACGGGLEPGAGDDPAFACGCTRCGRRYPRRHGVVSFILPERLDATARRELEGNRIDLGDPDIVCRAARKGQDNPVYTWQMNRTAGVLDRLMAGYPRRTLLCALGSGTGFDLQLVLARRRFDRVLASDLSLEKCSVIPASLAAFEGSLGVFGASFSQCPLRRRRGVLGLVFQALHHAADPHAALQGLLENTFDDLIIVEPLTNWLVESLASLGMARRTEYSGLRPQWLRMDRVRGIAARAGRRLRCVTWWELPPYCSGPWIRARPALWRPMCSAAGALSRIGGLARFGCMAAIHFQVGSPEPPRPGHPRAPRRGGRRARAPGSGARSQSGESSRKREASSGRAHRS